MANETKYLSKIVKSGKTLILKDTEARETLGELGTAAYKDFTSSIDGSTSLPTASAVQSYVGTIVSYPLEASIGGVITDITVIL